jgi:prophage tail gpP-like protein
MADNVTLSVGGTAVSGWNHIRITRGLEKACAEFELAFTERYPGVDEITVAAAQSCTVSIGSDLVVSGYVDQVHRGMGPDEHAISVVGRGKCQDLQDAAAEWTGGQIMGTSSLDVATKLAQPFGIKVTQIGSPGPAIPQFNFYRGEKAWEIIEKVCRASTQLCYEGTDGNLILSAVGATQAASGFAEAVNVQRARVSESSDQRYSDYECYLVSSNVFQDAGDGQRAYATAKDPGIPRHRKYIFIAEQGYGAQDICQRRVNWEAARRAGRGTSVSVTVDSWRDSSGALWAPNTLASIWLPTLKLTPTQLLIGQVSFLLDDEGGTRAEVVLMPSDAFMPQPTLLQPEFADARPTS